MKALDAEIEEYKPGYVRNVGALCEEIIGEARNLRPNYTPNLPRSSSSPNTLQLEHSKLRLNLK